MKAEHKAIIGTIIGTIMEGMILENYASVPKVWFAQVGILSLFACGLTIFCHVGRWVQICWEKEGKKL